MISLITQTANPQDKVGEFLLSADSSLFLRYRFVRYYLPERPSLELMAVLVKEKGALYVLLSDRVADVELSLARHEGSRYGSLEGFVGSAFDSGALKRMAENLALPLFNINAPLLLEPVAIAKPWGQEIWFTGIEERGQSLVSDGSHSLPLPWMLSLLPRQLLGSALPALNLLKILDPLAEPVYGDLYFELHEEKREVYVVTHVDSTAWPGGEGAIRFGFKESALNEFDSDADFRRAYLHAVESYELVRRQIDQIFDQYRSDAGFSLHEPVDAQALKQWTAQLPVKIRQEEQHLREAMDRFTHLKPLREGEVLRVPCLTPHALQHGVRTIEFQTPVYERKIIAFAQKVLTQDHWDTRAAVEQMSLAVDAEPCLDILEQGRGLCREQVVSFDDFQVQRIRLAAGMSWRVPESANYALLMLVAGRLGVKGGVSVINMVPEQAVLLPAWAEVCEITSKGPEDSVVLLAEPVIQARVALPKSLFRAGAVE